MSGRERRTGTKEGSARMDTFLLRLREFDWNLSPFPYGKLQSLCLARFHKTIRLILPISLHHLPARSGMMAGVPGLKVPFKSFAGGGGIKRSRFSINFHRNSKKSSFTRLSTNIVEPEEEIDGEYI